MNFRKTIFVGVLALSSATLSACYSAAPVHVSSKQLPVLRMSHAEWNALAKGQREALDANNTVILEGSPNADGTPGSQREAVHFDKLEIEGPFGLKWGMSQAEAKKSGIQLSSPRTDEYGRSYLATRLPHLLSDAETCILSFGYNDRLWRVGVVSRDFANDPYGFRLRERYDALSGLLIDKYGRGDTHHHRDSRLWKDDDEFLMGLTTGRTWHYTNYSKGQIWVQLKLGSSHGTKGYYALIYENKFLERSFRDGKKEKEGEML